jgi:hypothetical protein
MDRRARLRLIALGVMAMAAAEGCILFGTYDFGSYALAPDGGHDAGDDAPRDAPNEQPRCTKGSDADVHNCGACGHDCRGGSCLDGVCQPWVVAHKESAYGVAAADHMLFFSSNALDGGIYVSVDGGEATLFTGAAYPNVIAVAAASNTLYWGEGLDVERVHRCPLGSQCVEGALIVKNGLSTYEYELYPTATFAFAGQAVYFTQGGSSATNVGAIWVASQGAVSNPSALVGAQALPNGIAADPEAGVLYWGTDTYSEAQNNGSIYSATLDGASVAPIASMQSSPQNVFFYEGNLYWTNCGTTDDAGGCGDNGSVSVCTPSLGNCDSPRVLASEQRAAFGLWVDDGGVYYTTSAAGGGAFRCTLPTDAGSECTTILSGVDVPMEITADEDSIYFTAYASGDVYRVIK